MTLQKTRLAKFFATAVVSMAMTGVAHGQANPNGPVPRFLNKLLWPAKKPVSLQVEAVDVAGVKLGMSPEQVRAALKSAGFTPQATDPDQNSWSNLLAKQLSDRGVATSDRTKVPMFTMARGSQGEHIEVWYAATAQGARATSVKYQLPANRMEKADFFSGLKSKYGTPTTEAAHGTMYCSAGESQCVGYVNKQLPYLETSAGFSMYEVSLRTGKKFQDEYAASMAKAIEAGAPKRAKATF